MAGDQRIYDTVAMGQAVVKINEKLVRLNEIRVGVQGNLDTLALSYDANSAFTYHTAMTDWTGKYNTITEALRKVVTALGGVAVQTDQTESDNKRHATTFSTETQNIYLPV